MTRPLRDYTLRTVPFRILRPSLKLLPTIVTTVLGQVYTKEWEHKKLAAKVFVLKDKTDALENPTRDKALTHLTSWYGVALELTEAIKPTHPELATILANATNDMQWLQPAWEFMRGKMAEWVEKNA